ncbi:MAG: hypothetical protein AAB019_04050 [Planctomycetota bacterium]
MKKYFYLLVILGLIGGCLSDQRTSLISEEMSPLKDELLATLSDKLPRIKFDEHLKEGLGEDYAPYQLYNLCGLKDYKLVLKGEFPEVPKYLLVYKVDYKGFTLEEAKKIAEETFGMNPKPWGDVNENDDRPTFYFESGNYGLTVYCKHEGAGGEGRFTYALKEEVARKLEDKGISVTKEEAKQIADRFLKSHGLYPEGQIKHVVFGDSSTITVSDLEESKTTINAYTVYYAASADGYLADGNTLDIRVEIIADGVIKEVSKRWMDFKKYKKYPTKTLLEAFESVQNDISNTDWWAPQAVIGWTISFLEICYYAEDFKYEYLQPCYRFKVEKNTPEEKSENYILLPAIKTSYFLIPAIKDEYYKE